MSTSITESELRARAHEEGVDQTRIKVWAPNWRETSPLLAGVMSALVRSDLILRSDGSVVYLDEQMGMDSITIADLHRCATGDMYRRHFLRLYPEVPDDPKRPLSEMCTRAIQTLGWHAYAARLTFFPPKSP